MLKIWSIDPWVDRKKSNVFLASIYMWLTYHFSRGNIVFLQTGNHFIYILTLLEKKHHPAGLTHELFMARNN